MANDEERPHVLLRQAGLGFAYLAILVAALALGGALYVLPLAPKVKLFLAAAGLLLAALVAFMAIATHIVLRAERRAERSKDRGR